MKKNIAIIVFLVIIAILSYILISDYIQSKYSQPPKLSISEEEWDFGIVKSDEKPTHVFLVKNEGGEDLLINRVRSSCGCLEASISSKKISPGKPAELKATFDTTGYRGKIRKDIYIKSNNPEDKGTEKKISVFIEIEHQIEPIIIVSQNEWNLGLISQEEKPVLDFTIENKGDEDLVIEKLDIYKHIIHNIKLPLIISPGEKFKVTFVYDSSGHELGEIREAVIIFSNDPQKKSIPFLIHGYIKEKAKSAFSIYPVVANLTLKSGSEMNTTGKFILENLSDELVEIVSIKSSADYLTLLKNDFSLKPKSEENLQIMLQKDKAWQEIEEDQIKEYLYITIAIPINISK